MSPATAMHPLAEDYLERLRYAARRLPRSTRQELLAQIEAHLDEALDPSMSNAEVLTVLERLGDPEDIVEAQAPTPTNGKRGGRESAAIFLLLFGFFLLVVGWIVGLVLLWTSHAWRIRDKLIGTMVLPGGFGGTAFGLQRLIAGTGSSVSSNVLAVVIGAVLVLAPIFTAIYLARTAAQASSS
jgi:hypothetical protein